MKKMSVLSIETSCDETSVAIVEFAKDEVEILHHETATQIPVHALYGGVVPEVAARLHVAEVVALLDRVKEKHFDAIAVTRGPGLATALRVGIEAARTLAFVTGKPIIGVNHLEGHLASAWLVKENRALWRFPVLSLLVSGGHSELVLIKDFGKYQVLGRTRDDASGEAFDKTAKLMGLGYPGGPMIAKLAETGDPRAFKIPRPMLRDGSFDFSFSGLKTAVRNSWEKLSAKKRKDDQVIADMCASIQEAIVEVLVAKTVNAGQKYLPQAISVVGGVSANRSLQEKMRYAVKSKLPNVAMLHPARGLHTDNAAMIATAGAWHLMKGERDDWKKLDAEPELDF